MGQSTPGNLARGPQLELHEEGEALRLTLDLPGLTEEEVEVTLDERSLTIRARRPARVPPGYSAHRQERAAFAFARTITLPCRIDADRVTATTRDGVLEVVLPKAADKRPRTIRVTKS